MLIWDQTRLSTPLFVLIAWIYLYTYIHTEHCLTCLWIRGERVGDEAIIRTCLFVIYIAANEAMSYTAVTHISFISRIFSCHTLERLFVAFEL